MQLKTFEDLKFKKHHCIEGAISSYTEFSEDFYISVIGGGSGSIKCYGNGKTSFEIKSTLTDKNGGDSGCVLAWKSKEEVDEHLKQLQLTILMEMTYKKKYKQ